MPPHPPFLPPPQPCFSTQNWSSGNVKILLNTNCSIRGAHFLPSDDLRSTMKQDCFSPKGQKNFFGDRPLLYLRVWMTGCPPLSEGLDLPLYNNIATAHLCLKSLCLPCSPRRGNILRFFESQNLRLALCFPLFNTGILSFLLLSFFFYSFFFV